MALLISAKVDSRTTTTKIIRNKEGHYVMIKGSVHPLYLIIINVSIPNNRTSKYVKQNVIELKGEIKKDLQLCLQMSVLHFL